MIPTLPDQNVNAIQTLSVDIYIIRTGYVITEMDNMECKILMTDLFVNLKETIMVFVKNNILLDMILLLDKRSHGMDHGTSSGHMDTKQVEK